MNFTLNDIKNFENSHYIKMLRTKPDHALNKILIQWKIKKTLTKKLIIVK